MAGDQNDTIGNASTVPLMVPLQAQPFIGIPYKDEGCGFDGVNCYGLVHLVLKCCCGIVINPYADISALEIDRVNEAIAAAVDTPEWLRVIGEPKLYDVALLRGAPFLCGIVIAPKILLHVWRAPASIAMAFDDMRIRNRFIAFYRHAELADQP